MVTACAHIEQTNKAKWREKKIKYKTLRAGQNKFTPALGPTKQGRR